MRESKAALKLCKDKQGAVIACPKDGSGTKIQ